MFDTLAKEMQLWAAEIRFDNMPGWQKIEATLRS
jgi:hypothetical protein